MNCSRCVCFLVGDWLEVCIQYTMLHVELGRMQLFGCQMRSRTTQKAGSWRARSLGGADTAE